MPKLSNCYNLADFEAMAKRRLPKPLFDYIAGAADDERTMAANVSSFDNYALVPRYLRDVGSISLKATVLGCVLDWPLILAPTGMNRMFHPDGEVGVAREAARTGAGYTLSTMGTAAIEDIAAKSSGPKIYQLYLLADDHLNFESIDRAKAAGFDAICLTVDTVVAGNRERDARSGLTIPPSLNLAGLIGFATRPRWCLDYFTGGKFTLPNVSGGPGGDLSTLAAFFAEKMEKHITWSKVEQLIDYWGKPFAIKGIQSAEDALLAAKVGATAVIISNHGGRQLDGGAATIDLVSEIIDVLDGQIELIVDGGFRRGSHIVKAMALGASACMTGRPYLYALSAFGAPGVGRMLDLLKAETERTMALVGCADLAQLTSGHIRTSFVPFAKQRNHSQQI
jgi:L-lactate dehydrogenase (cytochrome)